MSRALILPGGGSRGVIQVGMLAAYLNNHRCAGSHMDELPYDALYGTSVGALNGILVHQNEFDKLVKLWQNIKTEQIYTWNFFKAFGPAASLASTKPLTRIIQQYLNVDRMSLNRKPFYVSATCIDTLYAETRQMPLTTSAETAKWILASASAPIGFPVQVIDGNQYSDGGASRDYGIEKAIDDGYDEIIVLCPSTITPKPIRNLIDMLEFQMSVQSSTQFNDETMVAQILNKSKHTVTLTIYKPPACDLDILNFSAASQNFDKYYKMGFDLLAKPTLQFRRTIKR